VLIVLMGKTLTIVTAPAEVVGYLGQNGYGQLRASFAGCVCAILRLTSFDTI
jgi:hypothetical protein